MYTRTTAVASRAAVGGKTCRMRNCWASITGIAAVCATAAWVNAVGECEGRTAPCYHYTAAMPGLLCVLQRAGGRARSKNAQHSAGTICKSWKLVHAVCRERLQLRFYHPAGHTQRARACQGDPPQNAATHSKR